MLGTTGYESEDSNHLEGILARAGDAKFFDAIVHKFDFLRNTDEPGVLDEIYLMLVESKELKAFKETLEAESPRFTSIFRYDPRSVTFEGEDGCFSSRMSMGASSAYGRIFNELKADDIYTVQTPDEAMVLINKPSYVIAPGAKPTVTEEPMVLFSSRMFQKPFPIGRFRDEEDQTSMLVKHGNDPYEIAPPDEIMPSGMMMKYLDYSIAYKKALKALE